MTAARKLISSKLVLSDLDKIIKVEHYYCIFCSSLESMSTTAESINKDIYLPV